MKKCEEEGHLINSTELNLPVISTSIGVAGKVKDIRESTNPIGEMISLIYFQPFDWPVTVS